MCHPIPVAVHSPVTTAQTSKSTERRVRTLYLLYPAHSHSDVNVRSFAPRTTKEPKDKRASKKTDASKEKVDGKKNASKKVKKGKTSSKAPPKIKTNAKVTSRASLPPKRKSTVKRNGKKSLGKRSSAAVSRSSTKKNLVKRTVSDTHGLHINSYASAPVSTAPSPRHLSPLPSPTPRLSGKRLSKVGYYSPRLSKIQMIGDLLFDMNTGSSSAKTPKTAKSTPRGTPQGTPRGTPRTSSKFKTIITPPPTNTVSSDDQKDPAPTVPYDYEDGAEEDGEPGLYDEQFLEILDRMKRSKHEPRIPQIVLIGPRGDVSILTLCLKMTTCDVLNV